MNIIPPLILVRSSNASSDVRMFPINICQSTYNVDDRLHDTRASHLNDSSYWNTCFAQDHRNTFLIFWHQILCFCLNFFTKTDPAPSLLPCSIAKRHDIFRFRSPGSVTYHIAHRATPLLSTPTGHGRPHDFFSRGGQIRGPEAFVPQRGP